jgi:hypothetical protein
MNSGMQQFPINLAYILEHAARFHMLKHSSEPNSLLMHSKQRVSRRVTESLRWLGMTIVILNPGMALSVREPYVIR